MTVLSRPRRCVAGRGSREHTCRLPERRPEEAAFHRALWFDGVKSNRAERVLAENDFTLPGWETAIPGIPQILAFRGQLIAAAAHVRYC